MHQFREELERYFATKTCVESAVHDAHATSAKQRDDFIGSKSSAGAEGHVGNGRNYIVARRAPRKPSALRFVQSLMGPDSRRSFGSYDIDLATGELRRGGVPVPLQRQPALVLTCLVGRAGTLVRREELQAAVWGDRVHVDFDRGLNYCIRQLRETLDDDARAPRFIETVARQGYRFVAPVSCEPEGQSVKSRRVVAVAAVLTAVLVASLAIDRATGCDERHHQMAIAVVRALHNAVF